MIRFQTLKYKNFLSIGNNGVEYDFNEGQNYLIMGKNGGGKSTIIDAMNFGLYGKPFRKINKPQLVNSINGKHCEVEITFETRGRQYRILRTIKPNVLRVWEDGKELQQRSSVHEFQSLLTNQILRMSESSFRQLVVLGSKSFKPFMTLDAAERRTVIEDLLDIGVYQSMFNILKKKTATVEKEYELAESRLLEVENSIQTSEEYLNRISGDEGQKHLKRVEDNLNRLKQEKREAEEKLSKLIKKNIEDSLASAEQNMNQAEKELGKLNAAFQAMGSNLKTQEKEYKFFAENDSCPKCHQDIDETIKSREMTKTREAIDKLKGDMKKCNEMVEQRAFTKKEVKEQLDRYREFERDMEFIKSDIRNYEKTIADKEAELEELKTKSKEDVSFVQNKIDEYSERCQELVADIDEYQDDLRSYEYISSLLRDDGIKQQIIQTYLPLINKLIRKFLDIMEFNVDFRFDESFKETIKARGRDDFTYGNFSEGEKLRIDLCLLFTWRELSRMKNSAATNLLILDEIGESSLDDAGFDCFMKILKSEQDNQCSVIISHSPEKIEPYVSRVYRFNKIGNFSEVKVKREDSLDKPVI